MGRLVLCSFDEDEVELSGQANREERAQFQELSPAANLLQSQNAAGQLASTHCFVVSIALSRKLKHGSPPKALQPDAPGHE